MHTKAARIVLFVVAATASTATAGRHVRLRTQHGAVHIWKPTGYDAATAGLVLYVHGYYTDVDHAWKEHHLSRQFRESGLNALFIACEAPEGPRDDVSWPDLTSLLDVVEADIGEELPQGPVVAVGHSGAHRTLSTWLRDERLQTVALVDAMYGDLPEYRDWLDASDEHRLIDVGDATRTWTDDLHAALPETMVFDGFPPPSAGHLEGARTARIVYVRSEIGHMPLVTSGWVLPMLLRALRLPLVPDASREAPIRVGSRR